MSIREFARMVGVSHPTIVRAINDKDGSTPSLEFLKKLADATGQELTTLVLLAVPNTGEPDPGAARLPESVAREAITLVIQRVLQIGVAALVTPDTPETNVDALRQMLVTLERRAERIIGQRLEFEGTDVDRLYADKLRELSKEIANQQARITQAEQQVARARPPSPATLDELRRLQLEGFWKLSAEKQNQLLHALLGDLRIPVRGKEVVWPFRRRQ